MKKLLLISCFLPLFVGCLRYFPTSPEEEASNTALSEEDTSSYLKGEEPFFSVEHDNRSRLESLIRERKPLTRPRDIDGYHIGADDLIEINVFDVPELNTTVRVRPSGYINLPLIGAVQANGQTEEELQQAISKRLDKFVKSPQVRVFISEYAANNIYLLGRVVNPGKIPLKRDSYSLLAVLSQAGIKDDQPIGPIVVIPGGAHEVGSASQTESVGLVSRTAPIQGIEVWYDDLIGSTTSLPLDIPLLPGDVVVVRDPAIIIVDGEVNKIGPILPTRRPTLVGAIAAAQGLTYSADVHQVEIIRTLENKLKAMLSVDLEDILLKNGQDFRLRDGDIIRVPSQPTRFVTRQMVDSINRFVSFTVGGKYDVVGSQ